MTYLRCVMRRIVAAASEARHLIRSERIHQCSVNGILLKTASARMTMQALSILESAGNCDRIGGLTDILHIDSRQTCKLVFQRPINSVVGMARMTSHVRRDPVVLKMLGRNVLGIVNIEALPVRDHRVAGNAKFCLFGTLHMSVHACHYAHSRQHTQSNEGQHLPCRTGRQGGTNQEDRSQHDTQDNLTDENRNHESSYVNA